MHLPDVAVDDVGEQLRQGGGVGEVHFPVVRVDRTLCVAVPGLLFFCQLPVAGLHGC